MNPEDEKEFIRSALEDPRADLPPELVEDLTPEERSMYQQHRILDTNLRTGLKDLTADLESKLSREDAFKARLLEGIKKEPAPAGLFWLRLRIKDVLEKLREVFWYEPGPVYRWTPALILLLVIPIVPLMMSEQSTREFARNDAPISDGVKKEVKAPGIEKGLAQKTKSKKDAKTRAYEKGLKKSARAKPGILAFRRGGKPAAPANKKADAPRDAKADFAARTASRSRSVPAKEPRRAAAPSGGASAPKAKTAGADASRTSADAPRPAPVAENRPVTVRRRAKLARKAAPAKKTYLKDEVRKKEAKQKSTRIRKESDKNKDTREQELLARLQKARTPEAKRKVLKELEQLYRAKSAVRKLRRIREKLKTFK